MAKRFERVKEIVMAAVEDNIMGEAAKVSFYFFLAIFPFIIVVFALTGFLGGERVTEWAMEHLYQVAPPEAAEYFGQFVRQVTEQEQPGLFSVGLLLTLWAASNMFVGLADGLNTMYNIDESRNYFKLRAVALGLLLASLFTLLGSVLVVLAGPQIAAFFGLGFVWEVLRWPLALVLVIIQLWLFYYVLPNRDQGNVKKETLIGAVVGAVLWLLVTLGFNVYVANFGGFDEMYGFLGGVVVLLMWMYVGSAAILFGGEVAAHLEDGSSARSGGEARGSRRRTRRS